jgi:hypothetical protein
MLLSGLPLRACFENHAGLRANRRSISRIIASFSRVSEYDDKEISFNMVERLYGGITEGEIIPVSITNV